MTHSEIRSWPGISSLKSILLHRLLRWLSHVIWMPDSRLSHRLLYGQLRQCHRSVGRQKKRLKDHIMSILKKCNFPHNRLRALASNRDAWRSTCAFEMSYFGADYDRAAALRRSRRHQHDAVLRQLQDSAHQCPLCGKQSNSHIGLFSHTKSRIQRWRGRRCQPYLMDSCWKELVVALVVLVVQY